MRTTTAMFAFVCVTLLRAAASEAGPISFVKMEFAPIAYFQGTAHFSNLDPPHFHYFRDECPPPPIPPACFTGAGPGPCTVWQTPFEIGEVEARTVVLKGEAEHIVAPHNGETPCAEVINYRAAVSVPQNGVIRNVVFYQYGDHSPHYDEHGVALAAFSIIRPGGWEKRGYVHSSMGVHRGTGGRPRAAIIDGHSEVPPDTSAAFGTMLMDVDSVSHHVSLFVNIDEIPPSQISSARIHVGWPGENGPVAFDLAPYASWQPFGPEGSAVGMQNVPFPAAWMPDLLNGHCYLNVSTFEQPAGAVRGQIEAAPEPVAAVDPSLASASQGSSFVSPNPFFEAAAIHFTLTHRAPVTLRVYDMAGRLVRTIAGGSVLDSGPRHLQWDGRGDAGERVPAGVYFYRLQIGARTESRRIVLVK
jgi:hypothetical protein